jgi:hypothetical protein
MGRGGRMCAQLMNPDRPAWMEAGHPTDAEKTSAFDGFFAYCGKYEVDEAKHVMIHLPEVASWPGFVGSNRHRPYTFSDSGDLLTFRAKKGTNLEQRAIQLHGGRWDLRQG